MIDVRPPAVAGTFYPGQRSVLATTVADFLRTAHALAGDDVGLTAPKAVIVPHAGYVYSGQTAALAYARLVRSRETLRRVVLLGPAHRVAVRGLALPGSRSFATPLGDIPVDQDAVTQLSDLRQVVVSRAAHAQEHSLEVHLPFLQCILGDFTLLPLAVGDATPAGVAQVLDTLWGGSETVIVISSDLSHFLSYRRAQVKDRATVDQILAMESPLDHSQACGATCINGAMISAQRHQLHAELLGLCNSGDTAGDKQRVVGYAAIAFGEHHDVTA